MGYLNDLKAEIVGKNDHPKNQGVKMQAHHLVSNKGLSLTPKSDELINNGYNINVVKNLAFIPCTLQGACHLETQLHRGDHGSPDPNAVDPNSVKDPEDENESGNTNQKDKKHPKTYHKKVADLVQKELKQFDFCKTSTRDVQKTMDAISKMVIKRINANKLHLTQIATRFKHGGDGCRNKDYIPDSIKSDTPCQTDRNHRNNQGPGQRKENIQYKKRKYTLKAGQ